MSSAFRRVFAAEVVSTFGSLMSRLAIPWLAVLVLKAEPTAMAWLAMADVAAGALAALLLGALVDRWPKRRTMIASRPAARRDARHRAGDGVCSARSRSAGWSSSSPSTAR